MCSIFDKFLSSLWEHLRPGGRDIGESIRAAINFAPQFYLKIGRFTIPVTGAMISLIASVILLTILAFWLRRGLNKYEITGKQALTEKLYFAVISLGVSSGLKRDQAETVLPWTLGIGLYIFTSNVVAIAEMSASAVNPAVPVSLALYTLVFVIAMGIHLVGIKGFGHSLIDPMPGLLPFNILDYMIKPVSLALRLFGNVFGAFILIAVIRTIMPLILPSLFGLWFDVADALIQALIFVYLTTTYLGEVVEKAENTAERLASKKEQSEQQKVKV